MPELDRTPEMASNERALGPAAADASEGSSILHEEF